DSSGGERHLLRRGRELQPDGTGDGGPAGAAEAEEHSGDGGGCSDQCECRVHAADCFAAQAGGACDSCGASDGTSGPGLSWAGLSAMMSFTARRYDNGEPVRIAIAHERIVEVEPLWTRESLDDWPWVAPAFFDLQINGYGGVWFADEKLTVDQVLEVLAGY